MNNNILIIGSIYNKIDSFGFNCVVGVMETRTVEEDRVTDCFKIEVQN